MNVLHQSGDIIQNRYQILGKLGHGGNGITYAAQDLSTQKQVAIKVLSLHQIDDWKVLELFEREAQILERLNHPAIPSYIEHFQIDTPSDRLFYLVQELAPGQSLSTIVEKGKHFTEAEVKEIAFQMLSILKYLHRLTPPVIHRDIKPQNIICNTDGRIFLVDFGSVRDTYRNTQTNGTFVGTFGYMPPEQFRGQAVFGSDLYSLGATLLFLLTHRSPADLPQNRMKIEFRNYVNISQPFADWLEKMLEPMLEDRFNSAKSATDMLYNSTLPQSSIVPQPHQLKGSRVRINSVSDRLTIKIPPAGLFNPTTIFVGIFALFWNGFLTFWTSFALLAAFAGVWFFPLFSIPFWLVGISLLKVVIFAAAGSYSLEIDRNSFQLAWSCLGFKGKRQGETSDLAKVEVEVQVNSKGSKTTYLTLWEGVKKHRLETPLEEVEQEWLVQEISVFLNRMK